MFMLVIVVPVVTRTVGRTGGSHVVMRSPGLLRDRRMRLGVGDGLVVLGRLILHHDFMTPKMPWRGTERSQSFPR